jgi:hypothetical protein
MPHRIEQAKSIIGLNHALISALQPNNILVAIRVTVGLCLHRRWMELRMAKISGIANGIPG